MGRETYALKFCPDGAIATSALNSAENWAETPLALGRHGSSRQDLQAHLSYALLKKRIIGRAFDNMPPLKCF